ncbi:polysaccharide deacetylase family protein [Sphingomonas sp.]|uniref:polysaccharide deacetylase family protein n=1 Tax=Sphingomonas sp. TaxID=28214 RepID=UPI0035C7D787
MFRALLVALALAAAASTPAAARWPNGARAAVALTYDDALASQLDNAAPALERAGLRGTFFLSSVRREHVARWRALAKKGHELANHSLFHPCPAASYPADPRYTSEAYSPAQMVREIAQQETLLTALDGRRAHGFASPCTINQVNGQDYLEPLRTAGIVTYGRTAVAAEPVDASRLDPMRIPALETPENPSGAQLIAFAERARVNGGLAVYVFHGVGGDYLQTANPAHEALLVWLKAHRRDIWVAPLGEIVAWTKAHP